MKLFSIAAGIAALGISSAQAEGPKAFSGSDTLAGVVTDALAASGMDSSLVYVGGGSGNGEKSMVNGEQGIAPMSREAKPEIIEKAAAAGMQLVPHVIGLDGLAVFVNDGNKFAGIDVPAVKKIFTCEITQWQDIPGSKLSGQIKVYRRNDASGTTDAFKHFTGIKEFGACVTVLAETADIAHKTATEKDALGYSGLSGKRDGNHALALSKEAGGKLVNPTTATIRDFSYPFARKLYVYSISGSAQPTAEEATFLEQYLLDRSFLDPIIQDNEFVTID